MFLPPSLPQRQYIFIHDTLLELLKVGETEISIQNLRRRHKELQAQNPETELSGLEQEFVVSEVTFSCPRNLLISYKVPLCYPLLIIIINQILLSTSANHGAMLKH